MPRGPVQITLLLIYLPAAIGYLFWIFGMDDVMNAVSVFALYILLPGLPILLIGRLAHLWEKIQQGAPWLLSPT